MNLMLLEEGRDDATLPPSDPRALHIRNILRMQPGDVFDVGVVNGPRGKARIVTDDADGMLLRFRWGTLPPPPLPAALLVGLSRPQTMRKVLREAAALGVGELHFVQCEKSEPSYASSSLWTGGEWRDQLVQGAEQAFNTHVPTVVHHPTVEAASQALATIRQRLVLDNYEATLPLAGWSPGAPTAAALKETAIVATLAVGPERGWSSAERDTFRASGWNMVHLGPRVLRTETAVVGGWMVLAAALGSLDKLDIP